MSKYEGLRMTAAFRGRFLNMPFKEGFKGMLKKNTNSVTMWSSVLPAPMKHQMDNMKVLATDYKNWSIYYWCEDNKVIGKVSNTIDRIHILGRTPSIK